jgi:NAD(P) transhydrogenase subunit beta
MSEGIVSAAYIAASILFILSLGGLSNQESAKRAIWFGIAGMAIAVVATVAGPGIGNLLAIVVMVAGGAVIGTVVAKKVAMTDMPQLVAALHSFVGLAAVFIGLNADMALSLANDAKAAGTVAELQNFAALVAKKTPAEINVMLVEIGLGVFIGAVTFTGSIVAFLKLAGKVDGKPVQLPGGHMLNALAAAICVVLLVAYIAGAGLWSVVVIAIIAGFIGYHLIMGIGGADMPVVVSMLNSYSGWAAAAIGFTLGNDLLIVVRLWALRARS